MATESGEPALTPGKRIERARKALGLSEAELGGILDMTTQGVKSMEGGGPSNYPKLPNALILSRALGIDLWDLAFGDEAEAVKQRIKPKTPSEEGTLLGRRPASRFTLLTTP